MFCARCGEQIPEASEVCPLCGRDTRLSLPPAAPQGVPAPAPAPDPAPVARSPIRKDLQGVGGWLLVFCIIFTILWPFWMVRQYARYLALHPHLLMNPMDDLRILCLAFGVVVGVTLWMQSPAAIFLLRIYFVFAGLLTVLNIGGLVLAGFSQHIFNNRAGLEIWFRIALRAVGPSLVFLALGITYFSRSERVHATYGRRLFTS
jgi:hypothetical protein